MRRHAQALIVATAMFMLLGAASASATYVHSGELDDSSVPGGFGSLLGAAVDQSGGDAYFVDSEGSIGVDRFDSAGAFENKITGLSFPIDVALDNSETASDGAVYVTDAGTGTVNAYDASGAPILTFGAAGQINGAEDVPADPDTAPDGAFSFPCGVAVDASGNIFVSDNSKGSIYVYAPSGQYLAQISDPSFSGPCDLAFDSSGDLYVAGLGGSVEKLEKTGPTSFSHLATIAPSAYGLAVDGGDRLYVATGSVVQRFRPNGEAIGSFGSADIAGGLTFIAIDQSAERAYVTDTAEVRVFDNAPEPLITTGVASGVTGTTATLHGQVDPNGLQVTECGFEYGKTTTYGFFPVCAEDPGSGSGNVEVSTDLTNLEPNRTYHFRLTAKNLNGAGIPGEDGTFVTEAVAPTVTSKPASASSDSATLRGAVNPHNSATTYRFEWGETTSYGNTLPLGSEATLSPTANAPITVTGQIVGKLTPETTYHFRVVATNSAGTTEGPDRAFTTPGAVAAFQLPDDRAWEMVSPPDKNGGDVMSVSQRTRAAADGDAVQFASLAGFAGSEGMGISADYIARRTAAPGTNGWSTHGIGPRQDPQNSLLAFIGPGDELYVDELSDDLSKGVVRAGGTVGVSSNAATVQNLLLRTDLLTPGPGSYQLLTDSFEPIGPQGLSTSVNYKPFLAGASEDFDHVIFQSNLNLVPGAGGNQQKLYEWEAGPGGGVERLVGVLPADEGGGISPGAVAGRGVSGTNPRYGNEAISDDGSRIFFTVQDEPGEGVSDGSTSGTLYVRENATTTTRISGAQSAEFWRITPDGRYAFFTTKEALLGADVDSDSDLYRFDLESPPGSRLMLLSSNGAKSAKAIGALGVSEDGQRVYFITDATQLVEGAPTGLTGPPIYLWDHGQLSYVGQLFIDHGEYGPAIGREGWQFGPRISRVSPDGSHLLFLTVEGNQVEPHDHGSVCHNNLPGDPCRELYLYNAEAKGGEGELKCVSCDPEGAPATGESSFDQLYGNNGGANRTSHQNHPLTDDGRWVFFHTPEKLVRGDVNGVSDVYRYETASGELALLSSGEDPDPSYFLDASRDGRDVFFATREALSGWDVDNSYDVYDARVGGGLPEPAPEPPGCIGDACQPAPRELNDPTPASAAFAGAGNQAGRKASARKRCAKGERRARRHGKARCVKKRANKNRTNHDRRTSR